MTEIAVYIEGGGNDRGQKAGLRQGFDALFKQEKSNARKKGLSLTFVCCGGRQEAYDAFKNEVKVNPKRISALLVDSEGPIVAVPEDRAEDALIRVEHLRQRQGDGWEIPDDLAERVHLMVQCMEAWIVADPGALEDFYQQNFKRTKLPKRKNLEEEPKLDIYSKLADATKGTQKGAYGKIKHASKLLQKIDAMKVAVHCPRFAIFQSWLEKTVSE